MIYDDNYKYFENGYNDEDFDSDIEELEYLIRLKSKEKTKRIQAERREKIKQFMEVE